MSPTAAAEAAELRAAELALGNLPERALTLLYRSLVQNRHLSPLEHPARPMTEWELDAFRQVEAEFFTPDGTRTLRVAPAFVDAVNAGNVPVRLTGTPRDVYYCGNYNGWVQLRKLIPGEAVYVDTERKDRT